MDNTGSSNTVILFLSSLLTPECIGSRMGKARKVHEAVMFYIRKAIGLVVMIMMVLSVIIQLRANVTMVIMEEVMVRMKKDEVGVSSRAAPPFVRALTTLQ